jgi:hypothetical protein
MAPSPLSPEEMGAKATPSLAPTLFEELYGQDQNAMAEMMDDDSLGPNERILATELLIGAKTLKSLDKDDRALLNHMAYHLAAKTAAPPAPRKEIKTEAPSDFDPYAYDK